MNFALRADWLVVVIWNWNVVWFRGSPYLYLVILALHEFSYSSAIVNICKTKNIMQGLCIFRIEITSWWSWLRDAMLPSVGITPTSTSSHVTSLPLRNFDKRFTLNLKVWLPCPKLQTEYAHVPKIIRIINYYKRLPPYPPLFSEHYN